MIDVDTQLCGVIGNPVGHSLSPAIHNAGYAAQGLNFVYLAFEVSDVKSVLDGMRAMPNFRGLQYWLRRWLCPQSLEGHYLPAMCAKRLRRRLLQEGFEIIYCDPWGTFDFWYPPGLKIDPRQVSRTNWYLYRVKEVLSRLGLNQFPTWWASPFIVSLARKTATGHPARDK